MEGRVVLPKKTSKDKLFITDKKQLFELSLRLSRNPSALKRGFFLVNQQFGFVRVRRPETSTGDYFWIEATKNEIEEFKKSRKADFLNQSKIAFS
jgi:hypothetical protein